MTTAIKTQKVKTSSRNVLSQKSVDSKISAGNKKQGTKLVGISALLNAHLPRSFKNPAEVDAYIRALRDE